ncbi:RDD family protein [Bifidobacterium sp.]|uniref:RDD family protein n=1 Tax=Bifidobacterium sp. TaxID=41200 RepID=UPI003D7EDF47
MLAPWWRRAVAYVIRIILPASLLSQLIGSILFDRSSPDGTTGFWLFAVSAVAAGMFSTWSTHNGQSWAHRLLRIQVCNQDSGTPITGLAMGLREIAHIVGHRYVSVSFGHYGTRTIRPSPTNSSTR